MIPTEPETNRERLPEAADPASQPPPRTVSSDPLADPGVAWMREFQGGDDSAFDRIVAHYQSSVFHFVLGSLRDEGRAEDLTQEVFVRAFRSRTRYQPTARLKTWLFTIANRLVLNEIRAIGRRRRVLLDGVPGRGFGDVGEAEEAFWAAVPDPRSELPGDYAARRELEQHIGRLIAALPANQQAAIRLHRTEELSYAEIGAILDVTPLAVKSLLVRARERLRRGLEVYYRDCAEDDALDVGRAAEGGGS